MIDAYVYEGKFESTKINLSLTGTALLGGKGGFLSFFLLLFNSV